VILVSGGNCHVKQDKDKMKEQQEKEGRKDLKLTCGEEQSFSGAGSRKRYKCNFMSKTVF
jgi:uncharacterized protein YxeA